MRKFLSFIVLLAISTTLSFGQTLNTKPTTIRQIQAGEAQGLEQYLNKNVVSNTKATTIWTSNMSVADTSKWETAKLADQSSNITNQWTWKSDTGKFSANWNNYVGPYMGSATPNQGVFYFDGITNLIGANYGVTNCIIKNKVAINTTGYSAVSIRFFQLYKSFNADSTLLDISTDGINWNSIDLNPSVTVNNYDYSWKEINISQYAANKTQLWIRFRFFAPASTSSGAQYGGGYGWAIDDVSLIVPANNQLQVTRCTLYDGYTEIPTGIGRPMYYDADILNSGALAQTHLKLHGKEIVTQADSTSSDTTIAAGTSINEWSLNNYFFTPPATLGTYKVFAYVKTDSINYLEAQDTFNIKVVCDTCKYSRDNNTYIGSRWAGTTGTTCDPYTAANRTMVNANRMLYGINCVVNLATKVNSKIKAVLFKFDGGSGTRIIVAQSNNYYITADKIPTTAPLVNPPSISLAFTSGYTLQKDSLYYLGIQVYGGTDTVKLAFDNTGVPQYEQTSLFFDPTAQTWYIWATGNVPAVMIRGVFNQYFNWDAVGVKEVNNSISLFSCMPNPASTSTQISYELKHNENVNIIITDITGRVVKNINQGMQAKGNHSLDIDVTSLTSGTYFYTLKTPTAKATDKLIVVRR